MVVPTSWSASLCTSEGKGKRYHHYLCPFPFRLDQVAWLCCHTIILALLLSVLLHSNISPDSHIFLPWKLWYIFCLSYKVASYEMVVGVVVCSGDIACSLWQAHTWKTGTWDSTRLLPRPFKTLWTVGTSECFLGLNRAVSMAISSFIHSVSHLFNNLMQEILIMGI